MAHQDHIVDRLSNRLPSILPDHIQEESPVFEQFLSAYFEYLESEIITLEDTLELSGVELEAGTVVGSGNLFNTRLSFDPLLILLVSSRSNSLP